MTVQDIITLFAYNTWANKKIFEAINGLSPEQFHQDLKSSHGGIHGTFTHLLAAHKMWLSRWNGTPDKALLQPAEVPTLQDLQSLFEKIEADTALLLKNLTEDQLRQNLSMTTIKGDTYIHPFEQMMLHLINHSTLHRGQICSMIRQLGIKPPSTDLIIYHRQNT